MATVHADDSEEVESVQSNNLRDRISKKHIVIGVLGVATVVAVVYAIIKINNHNK